MRRWHSELPLMENRRKLDAHVRAPFGPRPLGEQRKRHPYDCGRSRCGLCHGDKNYAPKARAAGLRSAVLFEMNAYEGGEL